jgi:hypothetical protein
MVQLKPEIYKMIVESMLATEGPFDHNTKLDQQQSLARMMQASKVSAYPLHRSCREGSSGDCKAMGGHSQSPKGYILIAYWQISAMATA